MKKKIFISVGILIFIGLAFGGYWYYTNDYAPNSFVKSFITELEFKGVDLVDQEYFVSEVYTCNIIPWEKYFKKESNSGISKDVLYKNWEQTYFSEIGGYIIISKINYANNLMQWTEFRNIFNKFDFSDMKVKHRELRNNFYLYYGYLTITGKSSYLYPGMNGKKKFFLGIANGKLGWKIIGFSLK